MIFDKYIYKTNSLSPEEKIYIKEFSQFLIDFTNFIDGDERMRWIFNNISKISQKERNNQKYFNFDDFKLSLCYLTILKKLRSTKRKIIKKDIDETNAENIENFMKYLGLKIPFNKLETEKLINERNNKKSKKLLIEQVNIKKDKRNEMIKNYEINIRIKNNTKSPKQNEDNKNINNEIFKQNNNDKSNINKENENKKKELEKENIDNKSKNIIGNFNGINISKKNEGNNNNLNKINIDEHIKENNKNNKNNQVTKNLEEEEEGEEGEEEEEEEENTNESNN